MHNNKRLSKDSFDLSPSPSTEDTDSISDTDETNASDASDSVVEDEDQYKKLIGDFPVGLYVW